MLFLRFFINAPWTTKNELPISARFMKNILFICYHFYPSAAVAAKRIARFCKYLPKFGYNPIVLTVLEKYYESTDNKLKVDNVTLYRTRTLLARKPKYDSKLESFFYYSQRLMEKGLFPDKYIGWLLFGLFEARRIFKEYKIDSVYVSGPWFSSFVIAYFLKKLYKIPLTIEYRDQWSLNVVYKNKKKRWHEYLDRRILRYADRIVFVSAGILEQYKAKYPEIDFAKAGVIPNSFDPDDIKHIRRVKHDRFVITYAGNFYWPRTPENFLKAIYELRSEGKIQESDFRFISIGNLDAKALGHLDSNGLIELKGRLPHDEVINHLASSDWLLLIVANGHEANIPAKMYEYLAVQKPIFALCPDRSSIKEIIEETESGITANINDIEGIKKQLYKIYTSSRDHCRPHQTQLDSYNALNSTQELSRLLSTLS